MTVGYIASTIPAKVVSVSNTTLFQVAMLETGDALQWVDIAEMNGLIDPWVIAQANILIPPVFFKTNPTGIPDSGGELS